MCVTSLLCGPRADLWPFYWFLCKRFSLYIKTFIGFNDRFFSHTNPYILNVTQQCRCSLMLIFRAWATCSEIGKILAREASRAVVWGGEMGGATLSLPRLPLGSLCSPIFSSFFPQCGAWSKAAVDKTCCAALNGFDTVNPFICVRRPSNRGVFNNRTY